MQLCFVRTLLTRLVNLQVKLYSFSLKQCKMLRSQSASQKVLNITKNFFKAELFLQLIKMAFEVIQTERENDAVMSCPLFIHLAFSQNAHIIFLLKQDENCQKGITNSKEIRVNLSNKTVTLLVKPFLCIRSYTRKKKRNGVVSKQTKTHKP